MKRLITSAKSIETPVDTEIHARLLFLRLLLQHFRFILSPATYSFFLVVSLGSLTSDDLLIVVLFFPLASALTTAASRSQNCSYLEAPTKLQLQACKADTELPLIQASATPRHGALTL
ncbi:unnamed protein product, partial [Dibothriocephalus latus]